MNILIINTLYHPHKVGGAEVSVQLLAEGLVAVGHRVRVVTLHSKNLRETDIKNNVEISYLPLFNKYWPYSNYVPTKIEKLIWHFLDTYNMVMAKKVEKEILEFKPDIVHTNNLAGFSVAVWPVVKKYNIKLIHTSRDYYLFHPNCTLFKDGIVQSVESFSVKFFSKIKKIKFNNVDSYIGISDFIKNFHLDNGFTNSKSCTIYNGVDLKIKNKINNEKKVIGFIGRLSEDKGFDKFCEIAEKYKDNFNFVAAGNFTKSDSESLSKLALESNVKILGFIDIQDFINIIDAVVLPIKWNEPFGRVVVECALAGVAVYTNKIGGISELFEYFENIYEIKDFNGKIPDHLELKNNYFSVDKMITEYETVFSN